MTTTKEHAAEIRKAFKAKGWNAKMVSVRMHQYSMGSSIYVSIKHPSIPPEVARKIAEAHQRVDRCEMTGEILSGGNMFVFVETTDEVQAQLAAPYVDAIRKALAELKQTAKDHPNLHAEIVDGFTVGMDSNGFHVGLWGAHSHLQSFAGEEYSIVPMGYRIATEKMKGGNS